MRRITPFFATMIVASWLFVIGFAVGFEGELAADPALTREHPDALFAGLAMGLGAVGAALVIVAGVRLTTALVRTRSDKAHAAH
ncbi:hypothetical protein [Agromyces laixinhei]|uniref:hypothetical protein n=1 Tax=Agromyces laixinhei TaxID=2585717 RepID=UPI001115F0DD|nr:hypothetical protein [Agromyces laixinhei]